jgi:peptidoglycan/xylan/chitin deacetylase (PgdA/CDA1 family)
MNMTILNFHGVGPVTRDVDAGERNCWLAQETFESVLDVVRGQPHVVLTVDDGNASDSTIILPALLARGLKAEFFVCSARLDQSTFLTRAQVQGLVAHGMGVGSHGANHRPWRHLSAQDSNEEIAGSRAALSEICGKSVDTAACPFGSYDRNVLTRLRQAGYRAVYTSDGGNARDDAWLRPRTTLTQSTRLDDIRRLVFEGPGKLRQFSIAMRRTYKRIR